jgi:hypothetical protein
MTILAQTFLPFVGRHFMALSLLSAWHECLEKLDYSSAPSVVARRGRWTMVAQCAR